MENSTELERPKDMVVTCKTCQKEFEWSAREQTYYLKKGFKKKPQKCTDCREKANKLRDSQMFYIHCGLCGSDAKMIAPPPKDRVAICDKCYQDLVKKSSAQIQSHEIA